MEIHMITRTSAALAGVVAFTLTSCVRVKEPAVRPTRAPAGASLWTDPGNLQAKDLFYGPWGVARAPRPEDVFTYVERKHKGVNPGMTVRDQNGRHWSVKQIPPGPLDVEAKVEVALSRVLSAIGYPKPLQYFVPELTIKEVWGIISELSG